MGWEEACFRERGVITGFSSLGRERTTVIEMTIPSAKIAERMIVSLERDTLLIQFLISRLFGGLPMRQLIDLIFLPAIAKAIAFAGG